MKRSVTRTLRPLAALALSATAFAGSPAGRSDAWAAEQSAPQLYAGIGSASSEYWSDYVTGAKASAQSVGGSVRVLASDFQGQKHLEQFGAIFGQGCEGCAVAIDTASNAFTKAIVQRADSAGAYVVTILNRPDSIHPWDTAPNHWVAHLEYDSFDGGYQNALALIHAMGGKGGIVALAGVADNPPSKRRIEAVRKAVAENPGVKLLDMQIADWDQAKAQRITRTWLAEYGDRLTGIFSANDAMALGAVAALKEKGLNGKILVTGFDGSHDALELIKAGDMLSTTYSDGAYLGAVSLALAYAAATGKLDPASLPHEKRDFYLKSKLVARANVDQILASRHDPEELSYQAISRNFWAQSAGPILPGANR